MPVIIGGVLQSNDDIIDCTLGWNTCDGRGAHTVCAKVVSKRIANATAYQDYTVGEYEEETRYYDRDEQF